MLNSLTSFRFFAALMVFLWHVNLLKQYQFGYIGVSFFFVLSGFILTFNYSSKFKILGIEQIKKFYIARIAKIYPIHLLTFILAVPLTLRIFNETPIIKQLEIAIINVLLIQSYFPMNWVHFSFNGVSWSLSNELFFYVMFPFLICLTLKITKDGKGSFLLLILYYLLGLLLILIASSNRFIPIDDWLLYIFPVTRIFDFISGILLGLLFLKKSNVINQKRKTTFTIFEVSSLVLLIIFIMVSPNVGQGLRYSVYYLPILCLLIYCFAYQGGFISRVLSNKILIYLGEISFSFYMVHLLVIGYLNYFHVQQGKILIAFAVSIILSSLLYQFYEEPMRKKIRFGLLKKENKGKSINASA